MLARLPIAAVLALLLAALTGGTARASIYSDVLRVYEQTGSVPACRFSSQQLETALKGVDTYGAQYFADFTTAIQDALAARAGGACSRVHKQRAAPIRVPRVPLHLGPLAAPTGASLPAPMLVMAALFAGLALVAAIAGVWWWLGWNPRWATGWRHGWAEAGYRARAAATDFDDWLRSGS